MTATATESIPQPDSAGPARLASAPPLSPSPARADVPDDRAQVGAEVTLVRSAIKGGAIGAFVCAAIWIGLVAIATVGKGTAMVPLLAMAAGCGVFAGLFLGGCAGALAGSRALEQVEHDRMHRERHAAATR